MAIASDSSGRLLSADFTRLAGPSWTLRCRKSRLSSISIRNTENAGFHPLVVLVLPWYRSGTALVPENHLGAPKLEPFGREFMGLAIADASG